MSANGELSLTFDTRSLFRIGLAAFVIGDAIGTVWLLAINRLLDMQWWYEEPDALPMFFNVGLWSGAATAIAALGLLIVRQPRPAKVTWDGARITLWDGDAATNSIEWVKAKIATMATYMKHSKYGTPSYVGSMIEISDDRGTVIYLSEGTQLWYLNGHKTSTSLSELTPMLAQLPTTELKPRSFGTTALSWIVAIASYVCAGLGLAVLSKSYGNDFDGVQLLVGGAILFLLRTLYTVGTLRKTPANDPLRRRAIKLEIAVRTLVAPVLALPALLWFLGASAPAEWIEVARFGSDLTLSPDGRYAAHYQAWELTLSDVFGAHEKRGMRRLDADYDVTPIAISLDGSRVVFRGRDTGFLIWRPNDDQMIATSGGHEHNITALAMTPGGEILISGSQDATAKIWSLETGELLYTLSAHERGVQGVGVSSDGSVVFTAGEDKTAFLWDGRTGEKRMAFEQAKSWIATGALSESGTRAATGEDEGTIRIFDATNGAKLAELKAHEGRVHLMRFSPDGRWLATGGYDRKIKVFDEKGEPIVEVDLRRDEYFREIGELPRSFAFTEDQRALFFATEHTDAVLSVELTGLR